MSWDVHYTTHTVDGVPVVVGVFNFTYNYGRMLMMAADIPHSWKDDLLLAPGNALDLIQRTHEAMTTDRGLIRAQQVSNDWGNFDQLLSQMQEMLELVKKYPTGSWSES